MVKPLAWHRAVVRIRRLLMIAWKTPRRVASSSITRSTKRYISPRASIARLGIIATCTIVIAPPILYAVLGAQQLQQRAKEQASVGARHVEIQLTNGTAVDTLNQVSISVLHATLAADSPVTATWVTDMRGTTLTFQGQRAWWPELRAHTPIRTTSFEGHFNIAVSTREVFVGTLAVSLAFLVLGLGAYYCFRRLPLTALDDALSELHTRQLEMESQSNRLELQNLRFDAALNNMPHGLCMFDADQKLLVCNRRYVQIYALPLELTEPGTRLQSILQHRIANRLYSGSDPNEFMRKVLETGDRASSRVDRFSDGRVIAVTREPIPGGGYVATHEDATEREKLNATLAQQHIRFKAALDNMDEGLCMFDAEKRLVVATTVTPRCISCPKTC
jgi:PAS domain-containing protein